MIAYMYSGIVITNQRVICINFGKVDCIEKEDIVFISNRLKESGKETYAVYIMTKDNKWYAVDFYDYKVIKEKLGLYD